MFCFRKRWRERERACTGRICTLHNVFWYLGRLQHQKLVYDEEEIKRKTREIAVVDKITYLVSYFPVGDTRAHSVYDTRAFKARVERSAVGRRVIAFALLAISLVECRRNDFDEHLPFSHFSLLHHPQFQDLWPSRRSDHHCFHSWLGYLPCCNRDPITKSWTAFSFLSMKASNSLHPWCQETNKKRSQERRRVPAEVRLALSSFPPISLSVLLPCCTSLPLQQQKIVEFRTRLLLLLLQKDSVLAGCFPLCIQCTFH